MLARIGSIISKIFAKLFRFIVRVIAPTIKFSILALIAIYVLQILLLAFSLNRDNFLNNHRLYNQQAVENFVLQTLPIGTPAEEIVYFAETEDIRCYIHETNPDDARQVETIEIDQIAGDDLSQLSEWVTCSIPISSPLFYGVYMMPEYLGYTIWDSITVGSRLYLKLVVQDGRLQDVHSSLGLPIL